ncbi:MAG: chalcone isomerase family protein [Burkholderiales bacterium]|nr:chalcone isomerase family protein [Burkholderiales bacterium]
MTAAPQLAQPRQIGRGLYSYWGFEIYQASLWVEPGFDAAALPAQRYALELLYRRNFKGRDIAERSIAEMRRVGSLSEAQAQRWLSAMQTVFPDVAAGDRLTGLNLPGRGAQFYANGKSVGEIPDPEFARLFFGIWLSEQTSAPQLRLSLLGQASTTP